MTDPTPLDGNAAAGPLRGLFAVDLTLALSTCGSCGQDHPLAEQALYERARRWCCAAATAARC
jgi:hypothetical protein